VITPEILDRTPKKFGMHSKPGGTEIVGRAVPAEWIAPQAHIIYTVRESLRDGLFGGPSPPCGSAPCLSSAGRGSPRMDQDSTR